VPARLRSSCWRVRGRPSESRPGGVVHTAHGEEHWHGATQDRFMAHVAVQEADADGQVVTWLEHVTHEEYGTR
jgi:quercetin dioxygenase-like cupin family protein